jgi:hypothetical protein
MADFVQNSQTKSAIRELTTPIASVSAFNLIIQSVITDNPFACVSYMTTGETHDPVEKTRESYTAKLVYEDVETVTVGNGSYNISDLFLFLLSYFPDIFQCSNRIILLLVARTALHPHQKPFTGFCINRITG